MTKEAAAKKKTGFGLYAPEAQEVALVGDFTEWEMNPIRLKRQKSGQWKVSVALAPGTYQYRFLVDGQWQDDPVCAQRIANPFGGENCVRVVE